MTLKNILFTLLITLLVFTSCTKDKSNPFVISSTKIGALKKDTRVYELDSIYAHDSIVKQQSGNPLLPPSNQIIIYKKGGDKLLILEPKTASDSLSTIENIEILDDRFHTVSGLSSKSYFKDIKDNYTISKINNTLSSAVVFVDSLHAYFTLSKKELPSEYQFNTDAKIEASKIPDSTKIKHFFISWSEH